MKLLLLLCLLGTINVALACFGSAGNKGSSGGTTAAPGSGDGGDGGDKEPGAGDIGGGEGPAEPCSGDDPLCKIGITSDDTSPYEPVPCNPDAGSDNKNFDCNDAANCQWNNAVEPEDQFDWRVASKAPNSASWKQYVASSSLPEGAYFVTASKASPPEHSANFVACTVSCATGDVLVGLGHWATENVKFEVCKQSAAGAPLENCAPVTEREGPSIVQVPGGSNFNIVVKASNFIDEAVGDVAVLDSLLLDYVVCGSGGPNETTTIGPGGGSADEENCRKLNCDFENDLCGGEDASELVITDEKFKGHVSKFEHVKDKKPFGNPVTGIWGPNRDKGGNGYAASNLNPELRYAAIKYTLVPNTEPRALVFDSFEATDGVVSRVCINEVTTDTCPFTTHDGDTTVEDRKWKTIDPIEIPPNTHTVYIVGNSDDTNGPRHHGVVGVDNTRFLNPSLPAEPGSNLPYGSACKPPAALADRKSALQRRLFARRFSRHV